MFWCLFSVTKHFIILSSLNKDRCIDTDSDTDFYVQNLFVQNLPVAPLAG